MPDQTLDSDFDDEGMSDNDDYDDEGSSGGESYEDDGDDQDLDHVVGGGSGHEGVSSTSEQDDDEVEQTQKVKKQQKKKKKKTKGDKAMDEAKKVLKEISESGDGAETGQGQFYRMQIQELLKEISGKQFAHNEFQEWYAKFEVFLRGPEMGKSSQKSVDRLLKDVKIPLPSYIYPNKWNCTFKWARPVSWSVLGSWALGTSLKKLSAFDIAVEIPKECWNANDFLNHKYHIKRAFYLTTLACLLEKNGDKVSFSCPTGDFLKPILEVSLGDKNVVRIHLVPPQNYFKLTRLSMHHNNLRHEHLFDFPKLADGEFCFGSNATQTEPEPNTPHYNNSIISDILMLEYHHLMNETLASSPNLCSAVRLLKLWLDRRTLNKGFGGFSNFILTMFVTYLVAKKVISGVFSPFQLIRVIFSQLCKTDWSSEGIRFSKSGNLTEWFLQYDVVFLDQSDHFNLTSSVSKYTYHRIRAEAKLALDILNTKQSSGFQSLFLSKLPFVSSFDYILKFPITSELKGTLQSDDFNRPTLLSHSGYAFPVLVSLVGSLIEKGLNKRISHIFVELPPVPHWSLREVLNQDEEFRIGLNVNREHAFKLVEKCTSEQPTDTQIFKDFWGDKSELRRFMDGSIVETVSFEDEFKSGGRVLFSMLKYIFQKHLKQSLPDNSFIDCQVEMLLRPNFVSMKCPEPDDSGFKGKGKRFPKQTPKPKVEESGPIPVSLDQITDQATAAFDVLSKNLRQLEGLPLGITSVQGSSSILRFCNVHPSPPQRFFSSSLLTETKFPNVLVMKDGPIQKVPKLVEPIKVVVQLEASGKWPDNLEAIERLKCAFLIKIGQSLKEQFGLTVQVYPRHLHVLQDGFVFLIRMTYFREIILMKQLRGDDGLLRLRDNPESLRLEKETLILPQLTSCLHAFHRQFGAFGGTVRLVKRWVSSQLLLASPSEFTDGSNQPDVRFTEVSIELIVASLFLLPAPALSLPGDPQVGFFRFLYLFGYGANWTANPLILNFNSRLTLEEVANIESEFIRRRETLPPIFISTPEDKFGSVWTKHLSPVILGRLTLLSQAALTTISSIFARSSTCDSTEKLDGELIKLFKPCRKQFNHTLTLSKSFDARVTQSLDNLLSKKTHKFWEYSKTRGELMPIVAFDPVELYLQELREAFGHLAIFLHDLYGGSSIEIVWKPDAFNPQKFTVTGVKGRSISGIDPEEIVAVEKEILESMELMGKDLCVPTSGAVTTTKDDGEENTTVTV